MAMTNQSKVISRGECSECGSSDGNVHYDDGHAYCFVCETYTGSSNQEGYTSMQNTVVTIPTPQNIQTARLSQGQFAAIPDRNISLEVARAYNVTQMEGKHIYPYYDLNCTHVANKVRHVANKEFNAEGAMSQGTLFGQQLFGQAGKFITICEGELDALSAYQMMGSKWPVVSVRNGAQSAVKDCKAQLQWLNKFDNIVLCFDNDEHGIAAASQVAQLFEPNKCKIMKLRGKDANEYLKHNKTQDFIKLFWEAQPYTPAGIVNLKDFDGLYDTDDKVSVPYPYQGLNDMLYGMRTGELITFTAGTGAGKSSIMRELEHHLLNHTKHNIGIISLEESVKQTIFHLMSVEASKRLYIQEVRETVSAEQLKAYEAATVGTGRVFAFDHFGSIETDDILAKIRYMIKALDCKYIILDHLSILVSGLEGDDERRNIDKMMTKLRSLVEETQCCVLLVSHLRRASGDKGQEQGTQISWAMLRGSHSIAQISDAVIAMERDQQASDPIVANTTTIRVLKNRYAGETGIGAYLLYDRDSGRMTEISDPNAEDFDTVNMEEYL
jgi:twinkle protein